MQNTGMQGSVSGAAKDYAAGIADKAGAGVAHVQEAAHNAMHRVSELAHGATARIPSTQDLMEMQERAVAGARIYIREHPIMVIGIALAIGILLSRLTTRR
jgi:ElaB/YqjD/DUF883 family membrane-anchored ribosome-binding protein